MVSEKQREHLRAIASTGGRTTVERHGAEHMSTIGRRGFEAIAARYGEINAIRWLGKKGTRTFTKRPKSQWTSDKRAITAWDKDDRRSYAPVGEER